MTNPEANCELEVDAGQSPAVDVDEVAIRACGGTEMVVQADALERADLRFCRFTGEPAELFEGSFS